jgi:enamine deaminase RidA (YjgF/YER057c/UK114 family)
MPVMTSFAAIVRPATAPPSGRRLIASGSEFERVAGFSRAVVQDGWVFVSGTTGFDYAAGSIAEDVEQQTHQAFHNIAAALAEAGAGLADVVRVRVHLTDASDFPVVAPLLNAYFADNRPANTTVISGLIDPRMKIDIEVTARLP